MRSQEEILRESHCDAVQAEIENWITASFRGRGPRVVATIASSGVRLSIGCICVFDGPNIKGLTASGCIESFRDVVEHYAQAFGGLKQSA